MKNIIKLQILLVLLFLSSNAFGGNMIEAFSASSNSVLAAEQQDTVLIADLAVEQGDCPWIFKFTNESYAIIYGNTTTRELWRYDFYFILDFGDGTETQYMSVKNYRSSFTHNYSNTGSYNVNLYAYLNGELVDSATEIVVVTDWMETVDTTTATVCDGEPFVFHQQIFRESGVYKVPTQHHNSVCPVIHELHLTVLPSYHFSTDTTVSEFPFIYRGRAITRAGRYDYSYVTQEGCDSIYTLNVSQTRPNNSEPENAYPFCPRRQGTYYVASEGGTVQPRIFNSDGYLLPVQSPNWFYFRVEQSGNLEFVLESGTPTYFFCWGPFSSNVTDENLLNSRNIVSSGYFYSDIHTCEILNARVGEYYVLVYASPNNHQVQGVTLKKGHPGGSGEGDPNIVPYCNMTVQTKTLGHGCSGGVARLEGEFLNHSYQIGETVNCTATALRGYTFKHWERNGSIVSTSPAYSFVVLSRTNINDTLYAVIEPDYAPVADFSVSLRGECVDTVILTNESFRADFAKTVNANNSSGLKYEWEFGEEGVIDTAKNPTFVFPQSGTYNITLRVKDDYYQMADTITKSVTILRGRNGDFVCDTTCANVPYSFYGRKYTESGIYTATTTEGNCTINHVLKLTVLPYVAYHFHTDTVVGEYPFAFRGRAITENGTYYDSLVALHGCDSIYSLTVRRRNPRGNSFLDGAYQICADNLRDYAGGVTGVAQSGPDYGCLGVQPSAPSWFYIKISQAGNMTIHMEPTSGLSGNNLDYCCWGPFTSPFTDVSMLDSLTITDCSSSSSAAEDCHISNAQVGDYYMLMVTNANRKVTNIKFSKTNGSGTGETDCDNVLSVNLTVCAKNPGWGTTTGSGTYNAGMYVNCTATPDSGYIFKHWEHGDSIISYYPSLNYVTSANILNDTLYAVMEPDTLPKADFTVSVIHGDCLDSVVFTNASFVYVNGTTVAMPGRECDYYIWNFGDEDYSTAENPSYVYQYSGTYDITLYALLANGKYDTITKSVTVRGVFEDITTDTTCKNVPYIFYGQTFTETGVHTVTATEGNCEVTHELDLTVLPVYRFHTDTVVGAYPFTFRNRTITENGTYHDSLLTQQGCDSIYSLTIRLAEPLKNTVIEGAYPICADLSHEYAAGMTGLAQSGPDYGCLGVQPSAPSWFYMKTSQAGNMTIHIEPASGLSGNNLDYCCWGPFASPVTDVNQLTGNNIVDCSSSDSAAEDCHINNAQVGQYYMLMVSNADRKLTNIKFSKTNGSGTAETDCDIVPNVNLTVCVKYPGWGTTTGSGTYNAGRSVTCTATPASGFTFKHWEHGDSVISYSPSFNYVTSADILNDMLYAVIESDTLPKASFVVSLSGECTDSVNLTNESFVYLRGTTPAVPVRPCDYYYWDFGDEDYSMEDNPSHVYQYSGTYDITLFALLATGEYDTITKSVTVRGLKDITVDTTCANVPYSFYGQTFTEAGVHTVTTTEGNCVMTHELDLTVLPAYHFKNSATIRQGESYYFRNRELTVAGDYYDSLKTANGCDSIYELKLTVFDTYVIDHYVEFCEGDSFILRGKIVMMPGIYYDTLFTQQGYDSVFRYVVNVTPTYDFYDTVIVCVGDSYNFRGQTLTNAGDYKMQYTTFNSGCDSIYHLHLITKPHFHNIEMDTICSNIVYHWRNQYLTQSGTYFDSIRSVNSCDSVYELRLTKYESDITTINEHVCSGSSYYFNGRLLSHTGVYYDTTINRHGCDSIVKLVLNVGQPYLRLDTLYRCQGDSVVFHNQVLYTAGTYYHTETASNGCDSTYVLTLFMYPSHFLAMDTAICANDVIIFDNERITTSGTYRMTFSSQYGCDSIVEMTVNVDSVKQTSIVRSICPGQYHLTPDGRYLTETGVYYDTLVARSGCDSIIQIVLNVVSYIEVEDTVYICRGSAYSFRGVTYSNAGRYMINLPSVSGCDTIYYLNLFVHDQTVQNTVISDTVCDSQPYKFAGKILTETGVYSDTLTNMFGCDSIITLYLYSYDSLIVRESAMICENDSFIWHGKAYTQAGHYQETMTNNQCKCTEYYFLDLSVGERPLLDKANWSVNEASACQNDEYYRIFPSYQGGTPTRFSLTYDGVNIPASNNIKDMPYDGVSIDVPIPVDSKGKPVRPDRYKANLMINNDYCGEAPYGVDFELLVMYSSMILDQHFNDMVSVFNSQYNGGYSFSNYEWYVNDAIVQGQTASNLYMEELSPGDVVHVELTRRGEDYSIPSCPITIEDLGPEFTEYPIQLNSTYYLQEQRTATVTATESGRYQLISVSGAILSEGRIEADMETNIELPSIAGIYVLAVETEHSGRKIYKLVVR